jgi:murein DD-endopeptidase MepM/ murein hydrolase activator NlpD
LIRRLLFLFMLINQNRITYAVLVRTTLLAAAGLGLALLAGCAQHAQKAAAPIEDHAHTRARFDNPDLRVGSPDVPYGKTDWKAVVTALNGAGKKAGDITRTAGGYGVAMWEGTGGRVVDIAAGRIVHERPGLVSSCGYAWPSSGKISRGFRPSDNHKGLDITAETGTPVYAARAGKVIYASNELSGFGNCIIIQHDPVWTTFYAHNNQNFVRAGDVVQCGQLIAEVGQTGRASGPHLHFEIRQDGTPLDPHPMLP